MNRFLVALVTAAMLFALQLALAGYPLLSKLSPKSQNLALQAFSSGGASFDLCALLVGYVIAGLVAHALPLTLTAKVFNDLAKRGPKRLRELLSCKGTFASSLFGTVLLLVIANHLVFPQSTAFPHADLLLIQAASPVLIYGLATVYAAVLMCWLLFAASQRLRRTIALSALLCVTAWGWFSGTAAHNEAARNRPDLIVIGIDSLRTDHLATLGFPAPHLTPTIDGFLSRSVLFERAYTPQARTFVAYMSIITGLYPINHGARENLYPSFLLRKRASIGHELSRRGYTTILAMDEARFANFDASYGFQKVLTPPPGAADFLIGSLLDTVGTNFLQFLPYSYAWLPQLAGNRAAHTIYRPEVHIRRLTDALSTASPDRPLFLVSHFCIAHIPFVHADPLPRPPEPFSDSPSRYRAALRVADSQVKELIDQLRRTGRLDNAIVVLLSDHGEALGLAKDAWHFKPVNGSEAEDLLFFGHGTPALDEAQSRVVLGIQHFRNGKPQLSARAVKAPVSLIDVAPTLLRMSDLDAFREFDGVPLLDAQGQLDVPLDRALFIESGMSGTSLRTRNVDEGQVVNEFSYLYTLTEDLRYELIPSMLGDQLRAKQRAVILGNYGLSSWPSRASGTADCWLLLELDSKTATCYPKSTDDSKVSRYRALICEHFRGDGDFHDHWCTVEHNDLRVSKALLADATDSI